MTQTNDILLQPFTLPNGATLRNRVVMAPMTTCTGFFDGSVTRELIEYYEARADSVGVIVMECCFIDDGGRAFPGAIGIDDDEKIEGLARVVKAIKAKGSKVILQIYHGGRMVDTRLIGGATPVGPSALAAPRDGAVVPLELTEEEVEGMIRKFGDAVHRTIQAGFDGVEIHGANTYLIQQFFSPNSNQRQDKWGGSRENRANFPLAVLDLTRKLVKEHADPSFIVGYRFSPEEIEEPGIRFDDTMYLLERLAEKGLDYLHFSMGHILRPSLVNKSDPTPLIDKYVRQRSERLASIPVIGVGGVINKADTEIALEHGYDLVAVGKGFIAYPDWMERIARGEEVELYIDSDKRENLTIPEPLWHFSLVESLIRDVNLKSRKFKAGEYQEKAEIENREFLVNVSLGKEGIENVELDDAAAADEALITSFATIKTRILDANSPHVDAVTGATIQSEAIKRAVAKALSRSQKEAILEEGGDPNAVEGVDVVVIGSGGAGLAAAIQATDNGANVLIIEKMPVLGGNTIKSSAGMNAAETRFQALKGLTDDKELFYQETLKSGKNKNDPALLRYFVDHANHAIDWLAERGIELSNITTTGGMSIDRTHRPASGAAVGGYLISGLLKNINARNIDVLLDASVLEIVQEDGAVVGVRVVDAENGERVIPTKAVIVATGGFSANQDMVVKYRPELDGFVTTNHQGATGGGIEMLQGIGADVVDMGEIQIHPTVEQKTSYLISESIRGGGAILVSQAGERFFNELETRDKVSAAIIALPEKYTYILFDQQVRDENPAVEEYVSQGLTVIGDTIASLAGQLGIDPAKLADTVERYNGFVAKKHDDDFGRTTGMRHPLDKGPYYAIQIAPGVHHTMGGVVINSDTSVLDTDRRVIAGVYAAGEVVGGIHGGNRIGGNAVADIIVFGIQAGHQASIYARQEAAHAAAASSAEPVAKRA